MAIGAAIFGFHHPVVSNAVVDVESSVPSAAGGTTHTWSAYASAVDVLMSLAGGRWGGDAGVLSVACDYAITGVHPALYRAGIRLKVVTHPDNPDLVGRYLSPSAAARHPAGPGGLVVARITLGCDVAMIPGSDGTA